jgi:hypothetical protein
MRALSTGFALRPPRPWGRLRPFNPYKEQRALTLGHIGR